MEKHNIFDHRYFLEDCKEALKKHKDDKAGFLKDVKSSLMYYYWSKCEWEILLFSWPSRQDYDGEKIDVYDQVMLNWDIFSEYLWEHRKELRKMEW